MKRFPHLFLLGMIGWAWVAAPAPAFAAAPGWWPFGGGKPASSAGIPAASQPAPAAIPVDTAPPDRGVQVTTSFAPIVKKVAPSVVTVFTTKKIQIRDQAQPGSPLADPFFQHFFGGGGDGGPQLQPAPHNARPRLQDGLGSGVIVSADGYILTNVHVVDVVDEIKVEVTQNGEKKKYDAKVIGKDAPSDIALLKIEAKDLPAMVLADSAKVEVGDIVLAIGNPFDLGQTVTMGIVSGLGRSLGDGNEIQDFIQTDAAINPGNSGGPLVDTNGRMVGLNSAIYTRSGGYMGIGFAIPSNTAREVVDSLLKKGRVVRGFLGVQLAAISPELAQKFNLPDTNGVLVNEVEPDSAAAAAGVQPGDVIVDFNGHKIDDYHSLRLAVTATPPGQKAKLTVIRDGKPKILDVILKELVEKPVAAAAPPDDAPGADPAANSLQLLPGVQVGTLDAAARRQFGAFQYPPDLKGAVVLSVDPDSPAAVPGSQGLQAGDVVLEVEHKEVRTAKDAQAAAKDPKNNLILLRVWTHNAPLRFIVIKTN